MSILDQSPARARAGSGILLSFFSPGWYGRSVALWRNRRAVVQMRDMDEAQLSDIGLTRRDVEAALRQPSDVDPSLHLIRARQTRMRGVRGR